MSNRKILVLGGTGPAGICLLRELVHRKHYAIMFARTPSKLPQDLAANTYLEVIKSEMNDRKALSSAVAKSSMVISLLGPSLLDGSISHSMYADIYVSLFPAMREHRVRRILAMGTISAKKLEDKWNIMQAVTPFLMPLFANAAYQNALGISRAFENGAEGLDWTVFRLAQITGDSDEASWRKGRGDGKVFTGWVGQRGWTSAIHRALLARWLVDAVEGGADDWIGKMPGISKLSGS
ncbi:hypothetical protein BKA61DRAFT_685735 [Leptodontidium sp. MPI-SDFR-AT-0119]|nr:hypothetical protein BKA61DRAFT_685735 [Leptodontidium sp. MPI-SDFR-AT-0119]